MWQASEGGQQGQMRVRCVSGVGDVSGSPISVATRKPGSAATHCFIDCSSTEKSNPNSPQTSESQRSEGDASRGREEAEHERQRSEGFVSFQEHNTVSACSEMLFSTTWRRASPTTASTRSRHWSHHDETEKEGKEGEETREARKCCVVWLCADQWREGAT